MNKALTILCALALLAAESAAQKPEWKLDHSHSQITFSVAHLVIAEVTGFFRDFDVAFAADKNDLTSATIRATIKTASIETGNERRDNHLRSGDFLDATKFPEMRFVSTKVEMTGKDSYAVTGDLTIRDITKSVVLNMKYKGNMKDAMGNTKAAFKATTTIDRFEFGATWNKVVESGGLVAGKDVDITLLMEFTEPS